MAKFHHLPLRPNTYKFNPDNDVQQNIRASDLQSFEHALKLAKSDGSEKSDRLAASFSSMGLMFNAGEQAPWLRSENTVVTASRAEAPGVHPVRDLHEQHDIESAFSPKQLCEMCDWLDELIDKDRPGAWAFEFETDEAELVEIRLCCHKDGQWSACLSTDVCVNDQQQLDDVLRQKGVALSWENFS